jgi:hypothetical protein
MSFYAKISGSTIATLTFGRSDTGVAGGDTACVTTGSLTTVWTRFSCSFNTGATMGASGNPYIYITQGTTNTIQTFWIDGVAMEPGATASPYGAGSIYLNGVISSPVNFQNKTDSTTAFQIQNSVSLALFAIDSANKNIQIGSSTTDANAVFLVLDSYSTAADPTAPANGAMYYNTSTNVFRCRENGVWKNCIDPPSNASTASQSPTAATNTYLTGSAITVPQGGVKVGTQFIWRIALSKTAAGTAAAVFTVMDGTNGTTADTARIAMTTSAETAIADTGVATIIVTVRSVSATGTWQGNTSLVHAGANVGLSNGAGWSADTTSGTFDDTAATIQGHFVGIMVNSGTANAFTITQVQAQTVNL